MPNYVKNVLEVTGDKRVLEFYDFVQNEKGKFDFNKIIPMPKSLDMTSGSHEDRAVSYYCQKNNIPIPPAIHSMNSTKEIESTLNSEKLEELLKDGAQYMDNYSKYGHTSWYGWCCENWGTKWNACDSVAEKIRRGESGKYFSAWTFDTAWDAPEPIFKELVKKFPDLEFKMVSANEDVSCPVAVYTGENGFTEMDFIGGPEGEEIAEDLWGVEIDEDASESED